MQKKIKSIRKYMVYLFLPQNLYLTMLNAGRDLILLIVIMKTGGKQ